MNLYTITYDWQGNQYQTVVSATSAEEARRTFEAAAPHVTFVSAEQATTKAVSG